jgi:hemerythrin-like domain-containing protein
MKSLDILKEEHVITERALALLEPAGECVRKGQPPPAGFEQWAIEFFRHFADKCHHAKEETGLFPLLEGRGMPREGGPVGVMLSEHERGRDFLRRMQEAASRRDHVGFALVAEEYAHMLRQHIFKENHVLFQMAESFLTKEDDAELLEKFLNVEHEHGADALHERWHREIENWEQTFRERDEDILSEAARDTRVPHEQK